MTLPSGADLLAPLAGFPAALVDVVRTRLAAGEDGAAPCPVAADSTPTASWSALEVPPLYRTSAGALARDLARTLFIRVTTR